MRISKHEFENDSNNPIDIWFMEPDDQIDDPWYDHPGWGHLSDEYLDEDEDEDEDWYDEGEIWGGDEEYWDEEDEDEE